MLSGSVKKQILFVSLLILLLMPFTVHGLLWREFFNSAHTLIFIYFFVFMFSQLQSRLPEMDVIRLYFYVFTLGVLLGALIEMMQYLLGREMSLDDLRKDVYGLLAGLTLVVIYVQSNWRKYKKTVVVSLLMFSGLMYLGTSALFVMSWHYIQRTDAFPVILALDEPWSSSFIHFNRAKHIAKSASINKNGDDYYRVAFEPGLYPGFSITETIADWSQYQSLDFTVLSAYEDELDMVIRIHDMKHNQERNDRYNKRIRIIQGVNKISVLLSDVRDAPVGRRLELTDIAGLKFFVVGLDKAVKLDISAMTLK